MLINAVGYANEEMKTGNQLVGFMFTQIGCVDEDGTPAVDISKIRPTGYEECEDLKANGTYGDISFQILKTSGFAEKAFTWERDSDGEDWDGDGAWCSGGKVIGEGDAVFPLAMGIWYNSSLDDYGVDVSILPVSGEALIAARTVTTRTGNQAIALPCSFNVKLAKDKVTPHGYEDCEDLKANGTYGDISFQILKTSGFAEKAFTWERDSDGEDWDGDGAWCSGGKVITEDDDFELKAGQAIWYNQSLDDYGVEEGTLEFPGLDDL